MRQIACILFTFFVIVSGVACSDDNDDGEEACRNFAAKCPAGAPGAGATCDANRINDAANHDEVEDCIEDAVDCNAAVACLGTLR